MRGRQEIRRLSRERSIVHRIDVLSGVKGESECVAVIVEAGIELLMSSKVDVGGGWSKRRSIEVGDLLTVVCVLFDVGNGRKPIDGVETAGRIGGRHDRDIRAVSCCLSGGYSRKVIRDIQLRLSRKQRMIRIHVHLKDLFGQR